MKRKLSDVLWDAANKHLWAGIGTSGNWFSCTTVWDATSGRSNACVATAFLEQLGCDVSSSHCFNDFDDGEEQQGVRYIWLLLAMHVAEDEGIEIEVAA
jgi:hypothetical protein